MANKPKQFHQGYWYHVYARSVQEVPLFETDDERQWFLTTLDEVFARRKLGLGALCLMDTHYHVLVRMGPVELDKVLNGLHMVYAKHLNRERGRRGSVFEPHPGTDIVLKDSYLQQLVTYIHNNPVEAGMVKCAREYEWSTDRLYRTGEWDHDALECWMWPPGFQEKNQRTMYEKHLSDYQQEEPEIPRSQKGYVGTETEWKDLEKRDEGRKDRHRDRRNRRSMEELVSGLVEDSETTIESLRDRGRTQPETRIRQEAMILLYEKGYGPTEIGEFFNRDKGTVAYAIRTHGNED